MESKEKMSEHDKTCEDLVERCKHEVLTCKEPILYPIIGTGD